MGSEVGVSASRAASVDAAPPSPSGTASRAADGRSDRESLAACADTVRRLFDAVARLERSSDWLRTPPVAGREWHAALVDKLLPQLGEETFLVVAVVGGTNIGKSVVFNHLAGMRVSASSPLASGTRHPTCLLPAGFAARHNLEDLFAGFAVEPWRGADAALEETGTHHLFWLEREGTPENLLILDTPDVDSDAPVNWERADHVRRAADVLVAVLTQQKYNDAAVKQFFRQAAAEDKLVCIVFNQVQLPEDDEWWPKWLATFVRETGLEPAAVYVVPSDRRRAEGLALPFLPRTWPPIEGSSTRNEPLAHGATVEHESSIANDSGLAIASNRCRLAEDLAKLRFAEIKIRTLRGAVREVVSRDAGVPVWLREIEARSAALRASAEQLAADQVARPVAWPVLPTGAFVTELRSWWKRQQQGWARRIGRFYDVVGQGILAPVRMVRDRVQGPPVDPLEAYRAAEWTALLEAVGQIYDRLQWMRESGSDAVRPRFEQLLAGKSRTELLERLRTAQHEVAFETELAEVVESEMRTWEEHWPKLSRSLRNLNQAAAWGRPVTSAVLFTLGWGPVGHWVTEAAAVSVLPVVVDLATGTTAAVAGETALAGAASTGAGFVQAKFQQLQTSFQLRRLAWLQRELRTHLLGTLPEDLRAAAEIPSSPEFRAVQDLVALLERQIGPDPRADRRRA